VPRRSYEQYCPLACALDLLGERWTLLVVRDLLAGPKRYTDLHRGLPGLATDLLTERLRRLEEAGVVRRRELPAPAGVTVYELTERGHELEPALFGLARFGLGLLGAPPQQAPPRDLLGLLLRALFDPDGAPGEPETWVFGDGDPPVALTVGAGRFDFQPDAAHAPGAPTARFSGDVPTLYDLLVGRLDAEAALADGRLSVVGDRNALERLRSAFPVPEPATFYS
jgi:DNA-binding HxlR family transcriptional regulator